MASDTSTQRARIAAAIEGVPADEHHLREVLAADLEALAATVPAGKDTDTTRALLKGARGALALTHAGRRADKTVFVASGHLAALLEATGANAQ